ncbi:MAG: hypothetical protein FJY97_05535 [candidate division Zixibacteria bacterium]|nr:hypothetical protein [candidate division Zixibacteria bacterium]
MTPPFATPRAVAIGLLLAVTENVFSLYGSYRIGYNHLTFGHFDLGFLIPFLLGIFGPNILLKTIRPAYGLSGSELLFIFCLGWIGFMVPTWGMSNYFINMIVVPHYFATPENQWGALFFQYLPEWAVVQDTGGAVRSYYIGLAPEAPIPWGAWVVPVFWWLTFFAGLLSVGVCTVTLFRKQWVEHERLSYPLAQIPVLLTETVPGDVSPWPAFMRTRAFRIGFIVTLLAMCWNVGSYWFRWPTVPINAQNGFELGFGRAFPTQVIRMNLISFTLSFFINVDVLFSIWVFQLLNTLEQGTLNRIGITAASGTAIPGGLVAVQFIGGMIAFACWMLWTARRHLGEVWRHVGGKTSSLRDEDEWISYRTAMIVGGAGLLYVIGWLHAAGMSLPVVLALLAFLFTFYLALCRVLAETGLVMVDLPINAHEFTIAMAGSGALSPQNLTALGLGSAFARNWKTFPMIIPSHVARLRGLLEQNGRALFFWCAITFGVSVLTAVVFTMYCGYRTGGAASFYVDIAGGSGFYDLIPTWMKNSTRITAPEIIFLLSGGAITTGIMAARYVFPWWPLSPIGFVVAAGGSVRSAFFPILLAWLLKIILLRVGGVRLYRDAQPLMLGILLGHVVGAAVAILVDFLYFPGSAHEVHTF